MSSVRVIAGGDVMFKPRLSEIESSRRPEVVEALALFDSGDICFMNCEMPFTERGQRADKTVNIRAVPEVADDLKALGVDVVTLANNHMLDFGQEGLFDTFEHLDRVGIKRVGAGINLEEALRPLVIEHKGAKVAFLGIATTLPPGSAAGIDRPGIAPVKVAFNFEFNPNLMTEIPGIPPTVHSWAVESDLEQVSKVIDYARSKADFVVVGLHWGVPTQRLPARDGMLCEYQQPLAHALIERGVDVIIGNGSHNLHGIEIYQGKPILYSLGDLIFHLHTLHGDAEQETVIARLDLGGDSIQVSLVPVVLNDDWLPQTVSRAERERVAGIIIERSQRFGTQFRLEDEALHVVI